MCHWVIEFWSRDKQNDAVCCKMLTFLQGTSSFLYRLSAICSLIWHITNYLSSCMLRSLRLSYVQVQRGTGRVKSLQQHHRQVWRAWHYIDVLDSFITMEWLLMVPLEKWHGEFTLSFFPGGFMYKWPIHLNRAADLEDKSKHLAYFII